MLTVETVIVVISLASMAVVVLGAAGVMHESAKARYRGCHRRPAGPSRLRLFADSVLDTVGELAAAHALLTGATHPAVLIGG